ncbi:hypothetical protein RRG08_010574 [Elysia crispata]|uniref:Uncharacterized protein n=1 Tax=Elysia crispata TaxID=231223 RepID=A0AAE0ZUZ9_9GAST|nr:hypothetical protein RRG08_010574 [Elysia crispata]
MQATVATTETGVSSLSQAKDMQVAERQIINRMEHRHPPILLMRLIPSGKNTTITWTILRLSPELDRGLAQGSTRGNILPASFPAEQRVYLLTLPLEDLPGPYLVNFIPVQVEGKPVQVPQLAARYKKTYKSGGTGTCFYDVPELHGLSVGRCTAGRFLSRDTQSPVLRGENKTDIKHSSESSGMAGEPGVDKTGREQAGSQTSIRV